MSEHFDNFSAIFLFYQYPVASKTFRDLQLLMPYSGTSC